MLSINYIRENTDEVIERLKIKNFDASEIVQKLLDKDLERRKNQQDRDAILTELNSISKQIGMLFKARKIDEAKQAKEKTGELKEKSKELGQSAIEIDKEI